MRPGDPVRPPAKAVTSAGGAGLVVLDRVDAAAVPPLGVPALTLG